jgi:hypothetical protein
MVDAARPAVLARGLPEEACFADAFTPAGRPRLPEGTAP